MINRTVLTGRLTRDPEVRKTPAGLSVCRFTLACDRRVSRSQDQEQQTADFISCVAWRQQADFLGQYAGKGSMIALEGKIQTGSYERDGQRIYTTDVVCDNVQLLDSRQTRDDRPIVGAGSVRLEDAYTADTAEDVKQEVALEFGVDPDDLPF